MAWNDAYPTKKLLENNNPIDCLGSNGLNFNDMKCLGYAGDYIVADWLGNQVLENNWTDWTVFSGNNKEMRAPFTLAQSSERSLGILPGDLVSRDFISGAEIPLSSTQGMQQSGIQIGLSKKRALVVWSSRITLGGISTIRGRLYDLVTNTPLGATDFPISTSNNTHNELPSVAISGDRAIVVWRHLAGGTAVRGRFVDLSLGAVMGSGDFQISTSIPQSLFHRFLVRSNGIYALVVWPSDPTGSVNIRGRKIDMVNSTLLGGGDFPITTGSGSGRAAPILEISGNYAVIAWEANARILNLSNPDPVESDPVQILSLSTTAGIQPSSTQVAVSGKKAIIAWMDRPNLTSNYSVFGRIVDVDTGTIHGLTDLLLSTTPSEDVAGPTVGSWGDYALIAWSAKRSGFSNYDLIKARVVDLANQSMQGLGAFQVNAQLQPYTAQAKVSMNGPYAVVGWTSPRVFGRVIDIANGMPLGSGDIYLDDGTLQIGSLNDLKITDDVAFASWWSSDANGIDFIRGSVVKLNVPLPYGLNNFFTAPLIERNYTVTSKIKF